MSTAFPFGPTSPFMRHLQKERDAAKRVSWDEESIVVGKKPDSGSHSHGVAFNVKGALDRRRGQIKNAGRVDRSENQGKHVQVHDAGEQEHQPDSREKEREQASPVLHLQHAVARDHVDDRKPNHDKTSYMTEAVHGAFESSAFCGHCGQFREQSGEHKNGKAEQQSDHSAQNLIETYQRDTKWAHTSSCDGEKYSTRIMSRGLVRKRGEN